MGFTLRSQYMDIRNRFGLGVIDKDSEERWVKDGALVNASCVLVTTTGGSNAGVVKNVPGTVQRTSFNIPGAKTIGWGTNPNKNKVYDFIKGSTHDYITEWDCETQATVIVLQSLSGGALNFVEGEKILNVNIIIDPEGNGDIILWSGDSNPPRCGNIERMKTWGVNGFTPEEIMLIKAPPLYPPALVASNSIENEQSNNLEDRFISFSYRWRYKDGYYSTCSTWTRYFFIPNKFQIDFETFENLGMLNINNAVDITFNTGSREVDAIEVLFKMSASTTIQRIDKFIKEEEGWGDNENQSVQFNNSKQYAPLPESEYYRSFDNVPLQIVAQTIAGNRVMYGNYVEGYDLIDKNGDKVIMDYTLELVSNGISNTQITIIEEDVIYNYEGSPIEVEKGQLVLNFFGIDFVEGAILFIDFSILSDSQEINFEGLFNYLLTESYNDLDDFLSNSTFINDLQVAYTAYFESNGGIILPDDAIGYEILQGFIVDYVSGDTLTLKLPVIKYEIDNAPDPNTFIYDYFANDGTLVRYQNIGSSTSLKSNRDYEICMIYRDAQGRKTTALVSQFNTLYIPNELSVNQNQIKVIVPPTMLPPTWATTYKFGIKQNKGLYQQIFITIFFVDGIYRWIKLDGANRGKVKEGDLLIVKKDIVGPISEIIKVKVLELKDQTENFLTENDDQEGLSINEPAGLYFKIKSTNFNLEYSENDFIIDEANAAASVGSPKTRNEGFSKVDPDTMLVTHIPIPQGSTITLEFVSDGRDRGRKTFNKTYISQDNYDNFKDWFDASVNLPLPIEENTVNEYDVVICDYGTASGNNGVTFTGNPLDQIYLQVQGITPGNGGGRRGYLKSTVSIRLVDGIVIFETDPIDIESQNTLFFETPEVYTITNGEHQQEEHLLVDTYNCFSFGNGAESYQIREEMNEKYLTIDFCPTATSDDEYRRITRYADITYSGVYNSNTNVNKLNEFNLSLANFKDDIDKNYGSIMKIEGLDTNLQVYQQDKDSLVYYGKDFLYNTDGTTNLSKIDEVLGQQNTYIGEYGISNDPLSQDTYGINSYHSDVKRGVWIKKSNNGLFEISFQGMRDYWKKMFRDNVINEVIGCYDQYYDIFIANVKYNDNQFVTWVYSDKDNGWLGRLPFNPEAMCRINGRMISFVNGEIHEHNQVLSLTNTPNYNSFYGVTYPSEFTFNLNQDAVTRKIFKTINIEGSDAWQTVLKTDLDNGYINQSDYERKEGEWYAYTRISNDVLDTSLLSTQGIGTTSISGNVLTFSRVPSIISVGDQIRNLNMQVVGTIIEINSNSITLDSVSNISDGDFVMSCKNQSVENGGLLGYYMSVSMSITTNNYTEVYSVGSEVNELPFS